MCRNSICEAKAAAGSQRFPGGRSRKYQEILRLAPKLGPAYNNLGALYFRQREYRKAAEVLEKGLKVDPSMTSSWPCSGFRSTRPAITRRRGRDWKRLSAPIRTTTMRVCFW